MRDVWNRTSIGDSLLTKLKQQIQLHTTFNDFIVSLFTSFIGANNNEFHTKPSCNDYALKAKAVPAELCAIQDHF